MKKKLRILVDRLLFAGYPPYLGAGIRIRKINETYNDITVEMKRRIWNQNYVGTHFGGSLYSMGDPFFMLILIKNLGRDYVVWDKKASIAFKKATKETVRARFHIPLEEIEALRREVDEKGKIEPTFTVDIISDSGEVIAQITKLLYIRKKKAQ